MTKVMDNNYINNELLDFLESSPTCFHAVSNIRDRLRRKGYEELFESSPWKLSKGGRYYVVRNESSIIAFRIPRFDFGGFMIAASHSDSPSFKVKTNPEMKVLGAYVKLNVEKYGGMLMAPWFDRPLSVAGRIIIRNDDGSFETKLVNVDRDLLMLPSLAIHMDRTVNDGHKFNPQHDLLPVFGDNKAEGCFMKTIAKAAGVNEEKILSHDLFLYARGRGSVWGERGEYISSGRLDDLQCSFANTEGFILSEVSGSSEFSTISGFPESSDHSGCSYDDSSDCSSAVENDSSLSVPVLAVFDNEEVGSLTKQGADSTFLEDVLTRINEACGRTPSELREAISSSFMISADNAHAVHPNNPDKADPVNRPFMNKGIVIKYNANQKYTTDAVSAALFKDICRRAAVPFQEFTNRSDIAGGSTLGNISNAHISLNTVDIGLPQLAMHSPYETAGSEDTASLIKAMNVFFKLTLKDMGQGRYSLN